MSTVTIQLPNSLHRKISELAHEDGISVEQFLTTAAAEKMAALLTVDYLRREAALGSRADFDRILSMVPSVPPNPGDELPSET